MLTIVSQKPQRESHVRPLVGLPQDQATLAWENAVRKAGTGEITARLVKAAVRELQKAQPQITAKPPPKPTKLHKRRLLESKIGEVPVLLTQKADYATLTQSNQPRITRMTRMDLITKSEARRTLCRLGARPSGRLRHAACETTDHMIKPRIAQRGRAATRQPTTNH